jgi:hypothetical protein
MISALHKTELYSNSSSKVKRGDDERTPQTVHPPRGLPSGRVVRQGASEDINKVSLMKWSWNYNPRRCQIVVDSPAEFSV